MAGITKGDVIKIRLDRVWVEGTVLSAVNYGTKDVPDWYIEGTASSSNSLKMNGYFYWKQKIDGGTVEVIDGSTSN